MTHVIRLARVVCMLCWTSAAAAQNLILCRFGTTGTQPCFSPLDLAYVPQLPASRIIAGSDQQVLTSLAGVAQMAAPITSQTASATLASTKTLTSNSPEATGLQLSLAAGLWSIALEVRGTIQCTVGVGYLRLYLQNNTAGVAVTGSNRLGPIASVTGQAFAATTPINAIVTLATPSTLELYAQHPGGTTCPVRTVNAGTDGDGETHAQAIRLN